MQVLEPNSGLLLVGHGTRSDVGTRQFLALAERLAWHVVPCPVEAAFLEIQQPGIGEGVGRLVARGIERMVVMPLLLFAAGHAKRDVPEAVEKALAERGRSDLPWGQAGHLGCHPAVLELSRRRMAGAVSCQLSVVSGYEQRACLLMVGRGSLDEAATAEMQEFARLRQLADGGMATEVAFLAMARPLLEEKLAELVAAKWERVIVQPHLLFEGELAESLRCQVAEAAKLHPGKEWVVAPLLADGLKRQHPHPSPLPVGEGTELLIEAIVSRCQGVETTKDTDGTEKGRGSHR